MNDDRNPFLNVLNFRKKSSIFQLRLIWKGEDEQSKIHVSTL